MENKTKKFLILLVAAGMAVSVYLSYIKLSHSTISCSLGQCSTVQESIYSEMFGIPVAIYGLGFYLLLLVSVLLNKNKLLKYLVGWGLLYSTFLTILEIFIIQAICGYCMISFAIIILIALLVFRGKNSVVSGG